MKKGIRTSVDWALVGAELANESDNEQVQFFKAFLKECSTWGTKLQVEQQFAFINAQLTQDEREAMKMISFT